MAARKPIGYLESADPLLLQPNYPLFEGGAQLGRDAERCEIILSREFVSRQHCALVPEEGGLAIADLDTTNGTYVNGARIKRHLLREGDRIGLGKPDPHHFTFTLGVPSFTRNYLLPAQKVYTIGRAADSDLPLPRDPMVSERHARLRVQGGRMSIEDLGSAGGTFARGGPVRFAEIEAGEAVRIGSTE